MSWKATFRRLCLLPDAVGISFRCGRYSMDAEMVDYMNFSVLKDLALTHVEMRQNHDVIMSDVWRYGNVCRRKRFSEGGRSAGDSECRGYRLPVAAVRRSCCGIMRMEKRSTLPHRQGSTGSVPEVGTVSSETAARRNVWLFQIIQRSKAQMKTVLSVQGLPPLPLMGSAERDISMNFIVEHV